MVLHEHFLPSDEPNPIPFLPNSSERGRNCQASFTKCSVIKWFAYQKNQWHKIFCSDSVHNQCKYVLCHFSLKMEHSWLSSMKPTKIETGEFYHHSFLISTSVWPKRTIRKEICNSSCLDTAQIGYLHEANKNWNDVPFWHSLPLS
jgi:hypothetical protein